MVEKEPNYRARIYEKYTSQKLPHVLGREDGEFRRWADACQFRMKGWLPDSRDARCLDVACGHGNFLYLLRESGFRDVTGVDISPEQVAMARRVWPNVLQVDALEYLAEHVGEFDLITGLDVVEHLYKNEVISFLDLVFNALRPGGRIVLQTANAESPWGGMHRYHDFTHETGFDPHSLTHLLRVAGFEGFEVRECGPYVHGAASAARSAAWHLIRVGLSFWNIAETGSRGSGVYTRIFLSSATRPVDTARYGADRVGTSDAGSRTVPV